MCVVKKIHQLLLLFTLIVVMAQFNCVESTPVDTSDLALYSKSGVAKDNSVTDGDENLMKPQIKKKKRIRKKKKKTSTKDEEEDVLGNIVTDLASIFATFLSNVENFNKDNDAIEVIRTIAEEVNPV